MAPIWAITPFLLFLRIVGPGKKFITQFITKMTSKNYKQSLQKLHKKLKCHENSEQNQKVGL